MRPLLLALLLLAAGAPAPGAEQMVRLPGPGGAALATLVCPAEGGRGTLVVINHGTVGNPTARAGWEPVPCAHETLRWFTSHGYTAAQPMRRGYGATGGAWAESSGPCADADYLAAGNATADDIAAAIRGLADHPAVVPGPAVVVGLSGGGWGSLALSARNPPGVSRIVNMAGGRGGPPPRHCSPGRLAAAAGRLGATARVPTLWVYAANDSYFGPSLATEMARRYREAGGVAELRILPPFGTDGHSLLFDEGGSAVWGPVIEAFLAGRG
jgi:dienelactone hydrolase